MIKAVYLHWNVRSNGCFHIEPYHWGSSTAFMTSNCLKHVKTLLVFLTMGCWLTLPSSSGVRPTLKLCQNRVGLGPKLVLKDTEHPQRVIPIKLLFEPI